MQAVLEVAGDHCLVAVRALRGASGDMNAVVVGRGLTLPVALLRQCKFCKGDGDGGRDDDDDTTVGDGP